MPNLVEEENKRGNRTWYAETAKHLAILKITAFTPEVAKRDKPQAIGT
jgi:hypothetical protein